ncbi:MAG: DUF2914 domain-containing protein [Candidatus Marinimicrobia bacterium]|nr:DUF2914 domain-containing protein [Candidatus Neomarinimicrobiota bacterium]
MTSNLTFIKKISFAIGVVIITLLMANACTKTESSKSYTKNTKKQAIPMTERSVKKYPKLNTESSPEKTEVTIDESPIQPTENQPDSSTISATEPEVLPEIVRFTFTSSVSERNPVDELTLVPLSLGKVFTHTVVNSSVQDTIVHVYKFQGEEVARVPIQVGASHTWRTWSTKRLDKIWLGAWDVEIQSKTGVVLAKKSFILVEKLSEPDDHKPELTETL